MAETLMSLTEACAVLRIDIAMLTTLLTGPNNPHVAEQVTSREVLACHVLMSLVPMLARDHASSIATAAGCDAQHGGNRTLAVVIRDAQLEAAWRNAGSSYDGLARPVLVLAPDHWLDVIEAALTEHRERSAQPN